MAADYADYADPLRVIREISGCFCSVDPLYERQIVSHNVHRLIQRDLGSQGRAFSVEPEIKKRDAVCRR